MIAGKPDYRGHPPPPTQPIKSARLQPAIIPAYTPSKKRIQALPILLWSGNKVMHNESLGIWTGPIPGAPMKIPIFTGLANSILYIMSNSIKWLLAGICALAPLGMIGQEPPVEQVLFECMRAAFPDEGESLDSLLVVFEGELISEGLLESEAPDYRGLLQQIASGQDLVRPVENYFGPRYRNLIRDSLAYSRCYELLQPRGQVPADSTWIRFETFRDLLLHEPISPSEEAAAYLDILSEADLHLPYYRLFTYELIDRQAYQTEFAPPPFASLEELGRLNTRGANVFRVYMNEEDQLIISDQLVNPDQLTDLVSRHARTFEQSALYIVEVETDVKYGQFITLKDRIALAVTQVRDNYARRLLGKTLTELSPQEQEAVFGKYPIRIVSP